jgi:hypothetical protein
MDVITPPSLETDTCDDGVPWAISRLELPKEVAVAWAHTFVMMEEYLGLVVTTTGDGCIWIMSYV